jgi:hypothetical protein
MNVVVLGAALLATPITIAQTQTFTVTPNNNATALAQSIVGTGVTLAGTPTLIGAPEQAGLFQNFTTGPYVNPVTQAQGNISIAQGVILSSGRIADAARPYDGEGASTAMNRPGDPALNGISKFQTRDAVILEFQFVPDADEIFIEYLFASTEYPDYVNSTFNDVFAFFVNGTNVAVLPGSNDPVTINSINAGRPVGSSARNVQFFTQYSSSSTPFNYGGATVLLTARATVRKGQVNTFRFAVADSSDGNLDSAVLIGSGRLSTTPPSLRVTTTSLPGGSIQMPYSAQLAATGNNQPLTWSLASGSLPPGLTLTPAGSIEGTPTQQGTFPFTVQVAQGSSAPVAAALSITILGPAPVINPFAPAGVALSPYSAQLSATGGTAPFFWASPVDRFLPDSGLSRDWRYLGHVLLSPDPIPSRFKSPTASDEPT